MHYGTLQRISSVTHTETVKMTSHPNILVIMSDDHGQWALGCYGNRELHTPTFDKLAAGGTRLASAFTPCPVCSPARASFFTGRLPSQHGIHDWLAEEDDFDWMEDETTLAQILQESGYRTGLVGKWHCGRSSIKQPGFDYWFGFERGQYPHKGQQYFTEQGQSVEANGQQSFFLTEKAIEFLCNTDDNRPFFLFVGYVNTHSPFENQPERLVSKYRGSGFSDIPRETWSDKDEGWVRYGNPTDETERREWLAQYYAAVEYIDEQVSQLVETLETSGFLENTLIIYTSDHGHMNGHHGLYTKGNATVPQNFFDESIHVPCLLSWPDVIQAGGVMEEPVDHCDLFQTILDAACVRLTFDQKKSINSPGRSYLPMLRGEPLLWRTHRFCEYGNARMIADSRFKFIRRFKAEKEHFRDEFYDLKKDPRETLNLIDDFNYAIHISKMNRLLDEYFLLYEEERKSGREILTQRRSNPVEPWRVKRPNT